MARSWTRGAGGAGACLGRCIWRQGNPWQGGRTGQEKWQGWRNVTPAGVQGLVAPARGRLPPRRFVSCVCARCRPYERPTGQPGAGWAGAPQDEPGSRLGGDNPPPRSGEVVNKNNLKKKSPSKTSQVMGNRWAASPGNIDSPALMCRDVTSAYPILCTGRGGGACEGADPTSLFSFLSFLFLPLSFSLLWDEFPRGACPAPACRAPAW